MLELDRAKKCLNESADAMRSLTGQAELIVRIGGVIAKSLRTGGSLLLCGNGGSASQCQHIAAEFTGRFRRERTGFRAISLTTDTSAMTAIGNDYGFDKIFARQVEAIGKRGDVLIAMSTSGNSPNIVAAVERAKQLGIITIGLTGQSKNKLAAMCDMTVAAPGKETSTIQECHLAALHAICEIAEAELTGSN